MTEETGPLDEGVAGVVEGAGDHAVGVAGQRLATVQHEVFVVERKLARAAQHDAVRLLDLTEAVVRSVSVDRLRVLPHESEDDGLVGTVAVARLPERAAEFDLHSGRVVEVAFASQDVEEACGCPHRADGV